MDNAKNNQIILLLWRQSDLWRLNFSCVDPYEYGSENLHLKNHNVPESQNPEGFFQSYQNEFPNECNFTDNVPEQQCFKGVRRPSVMNLFKRNANSGTSPESLKQLLDDCRQRVDALQHVSSTMIFFLKEFPMDIAANETEDFISRIDRIAADILDEGSGSVTEISISDQKQFILDFIDHQKEYIRQKEAEFKNIIDLLRNGMTGLISETQNFNSLMYDQNVRMEAITRLDDIRKIKESLKAEVAEMKQIIWEKQDSDSRRIESLSKEVAVLRSSLEQVKDAALIDALTGAYNRKTFDTRIKWVVKRSGIVWSPITLMMCDLDNFKQINDTYGHIVGDRILKCFVQECKSMFRSDDFVSRYGGEEFAILLPGISLKKSLSRAQSFCRLLSLKQFTVDALRPDERICFTVSIGVSELRKDDTPDAFIDRADKALYKAKRSGKNCAVSEIET
jgi:diguanylate cyclase